MRTCIYCNVSVSSGGKNCPLCGEILDGVPDDGLYPAFKLRKRRHFGLLVFLSCVAVVFIAASFIINALTWNGYYWSVITAANIIYGWFIGLFTFNRKVHIGLKLLAHAVAIPVLLKVINEFAYKTEQLDRVEWAATWAMPFIFIGFIAAINIIMFTRSANRRNFMIYQLTLCVIAFVPLVLVSVGAVEPVFPSVMTAGAALITIAGWIIFARKHIRREFGRKFHI